MGVPRYFTNTEHFFAWLKLLMNLFSKDIPIPNDIPKSEIYPNSAWLKAQKRCVQICYKLIIMRSSSNQTEVTQNFVQEFLNKYAIPIQDAILQKLSILQHNNGYLPPRVIAYSFLYLNESYVTHLKKNMKK